MDGLNGRANNGEVENPDLQIIRYSPYQPCSKLASSWFDLRVFYVRVSNFKVDDSTPKHLTLNHIPLFPDTLLEINGDKSSIFSEGVSSHLRRDRVDKKSEEATFVNTDSIRLTGSAKFEVFDKEDLILSGVLDMSNSNGFTGESKSNAKRWSMNCESEITAGTGFLKGKQLGGAELPAPTIEVYITGCFSGTPIILTKTLQLNFRKKHNRMSTLDAIPEYETTECQKDVSPGLDMEVAEYGNYKPENEEEYSKLYWRRTEYMDGEDGELSWFNAGVRVGVGIGLGVCLGIGIGVGLLVRTYQTTTRTFKRRLV
ncbi:PREDICTED: uncharacterized protein At1g01500 [Prunus mume]|uniref:Uncharacterized protein At1g01500 n=1 Tax=Prunus mume TaxID=102107 RepID=A0ABM0N7V3_PRUMU|nr:PREDICTED: uncharacterized protein At1g01500 [Prunus mume]XP_008220797.1 PREDICTED: uncharacterized protein At1g01500 [Prunus mume]